jgi:hypothetical protein
MRARKIFNTIFLFKIIVFLFSAQLIYASQYYSITIGEYDYDINNRILTERSTHNIQIGESETHLLMLILYSLDTDKPKRLFTSYYSNSDKIIGGDYDDDIEKYLKQKEIKPMYTHAAWQKMDEKWSIKLKIHKKNEESPVNLILNIEKLKRLNNNSEPTFHMDRYILNKDDLHASIPLSSSEDKRLLDEIVRVDKLPKLFLYERKGEIHYLNFSIKESHGSAKYLKVISESPFRFAYKYESEHAEAEGGFIPGSDPITIYDEIDKNESLRFIMKFDIDNIKTNLGTLFFTVNIDGSIEDNTFRGGRTKRYAKQLLIAKDDVIEIQLPPDFPSRKWKEQDPQTNEMIEKVISSGIKEHSLFIRPVRIK